MLAWWRRRSRRAKARLLSYPSLVGALGGGLAYAMVMPGASHHGALPPLDARGRERAAALRADVVALAGRGPERSQRVAGTLERAEATIDAALRDAGYAVERMPYDSDGVRVANLEATLRGGERADEIVVVGAHYDSAEGAPGADDNASGVAALLALARELAPTAAAAAAGGQGAKRRRTVRLVAFVNEEPPYFWNPSMGSLVYAKACRARGDRVVAMLSLETLGYYRDAPGTQKYPPVVSWFYPNRGDFVAFVGNTSSRALVREAVGVFRGAAAFPSEGAALPGFVTGVGWSDQWSFWQVGYPGVMVTDTAPFRNPNYHQPTDTPDTLDYDRLSRVVGGLLSVIEKLAE